MDWKALETLSTFFFSSLLVVIKLNQHPPLPHLLSLCLFIFSFPHVHISDRRSAISLANKTLDHNHPTSQTYHNPPCRLLLSPSRPPSLRPPLSSPAVSSGTSPSLSSVVNGKSYIPVPQRTSFTPSSASCVSLARRRTVMFDGMELQKLTAPLPTGSFSSSTPLTSPSCARPRSSSTTRPCPASRRSTLPFSVSQPTRTSLT